MRVIDALRALSLYPINPLTAQNIAEECGISAEMTADAETRASSAFKRAQAKVYLYLAESPAVTEAGAQYSFTDEERAALRGKAKAILDAIGDESEATGIECGYIGEDF